MDISSSPNLQGKNTNLWKGHQVDTVIQSAIILLSVHYVSVLVYKYFYSHGLYLSKITFFTPYSG